MNQNITSRKTIIKSLFWAYCETSSAQVVNLMVTVILARLLAPSDYGAIALVTVFINIANVFVNSSFSMSLIQKKDADHLDFNTVFWFSCLISFFLYLILFLSAPIICRYYDYELLITVLRVLALRIPVSAYNSVQIAFVSNKMMFRKSFVSTSIGALLSGILGIIAAYMEWGLWALVIQSISNIILSTVLLAFVVEWKPKIEFSWKRLKFIFRFGWKLLVTGLMFSGYAELRSLIIGKRYSAEDLGYYNRGYQIPQIVASNIDTTITKVMFPTFSKTQNNLFKLKHMTRRAAKTSAYIMTPFLFGMAIIANNMVSLLLTDKWLPCVPYLQIMCIVWWLQPTQSCSVQAVKAIGRSDIYLKIEVISKIIGVSLLISALVLFDSPFSLAVTMLIGQALAVLLYGFYIQRLIGYKLKEQLLDLIVPALIGSIMVVSIYFVGIHIYSKVICLTAQIIIGAIIYIGLSYMLKIEAFNYIFKLVFERIRKEA